MLLHDTRAIGGNCHGPFDVIVRTPIVVESIKGQIWQSRGPVDLVPGDCVCFACGKVAHQWTDREELRNVAQEAVQVIMAKVIEQDRDVTADELLVFEALEGLEDEVQREWTGELEAVLK